MRVLVACEESQRVCTAFRARGHEAYSCDVVECSGGHPEWHIMADCLGMINGGCEFITLDGHRHEVNEEWDLVIAHPPCTYLTVTGNRWFNVDRYGEKAKERYNERYKAIVFFTQLITARAGMVAVENPVGIMNTAYGKPSQIIEPYMFGDPYEKKTALWLKNLPLLKPTNVVKPQERVYFPSGKSHPAWYADSLHMPKGERERYRSMTFKGIAAAMASQWGGLE